MLAARTEVDVVNSVGKRLSQVRSRINAAAELAGRDPAGVTLIAVSKTFAADAIAAAIEAGQCEFGENRVQEALSKWPALKEQHADIHLHLIGPLQTNKVREAVRLFDVIHSLDRDKLAIALAAEAKRQQRSPSLFVQVNSGNEPQKAGIAPDQATAFVKRCRDEHALTIEGLMCIPPIDDDPSPHFKLLQRLANELGLQGLSMGMSTDFETAIAHGATHVRVGSAIFGDRG